jgi:hypothetical protein
VRAKAKAKAREKEKDREQNIFRLMASFVFQDVDRKT